jgi:hypothetical protein
VEGNLSRAQSLLCAESEHAPSPSKGKGGGGEAAPGVRGKQDASPKHGDTWKIIHAPAAVAVGSIVLAYNQARSRIGRLAAPEGGVKGATAEGFNTTKHVLVSTPREH